MPRYLTTLRLAALLSAGFLLGCSTDRKARRAEPLQVVEGYLKASYARDGREAYRYVSSPDRRVWDERSYTLQHSGFSGFALRLAQKLAADMEISVIDQQVNAERAHYTVRYSAPTADELASRLYDWDAAKLNSLSSAEQDRLWAALEKIKTNGKMISLTGQETFDLVFDHGEWKIFFDWASWTKVSFKVHMPPSAGIDTRFPSHELLALYDEPFQISFKLKNRSKQAVMARIVHRFEPPDMEKQVDMIACGSLLPFPLKPGEEQEISSAYLIKPGVRIGTKVTITYDFQIEPLSP